MSLLFHFLRYAGRPADAGATILRQRFAADQPVEMARRMLSWRMAFNRRELIGIRLQDGTQVHAARTRRIL